MKRPSLFAQFRLVILIVGVCILGANTFFYYHAQAQEQPQLITQPVPSSSAEPSFDIANMSLISVKKVNEAEIAAAQESFIGASISGKLSSVNIFQLKYDIQGKDGGLQPITAKVYVPAEAGSYPLFVFGSGTTGMADQCAPSLENMAKENIGNYDNQMIAQAAEGYVTIFPDYEGFHSSETQAYFISESEAKVLIGSIKSMIQLQALTPELQNADIHQVFLSGYSQGGHAALSAAQVWDKLPSSVQLSGVVQYAGAADVKALFMESPWLAGYLVDSYAQYYGEQLDPRLVLQDRWLIPLAKNNELCVNQVNRFYPHTPETVYNPAFLDAIETNTWPNNLASWQQKISQNTPQNNLPNVPYLSIQGGADPIVTAKTQKQNVAILCQAHKKVTYREYAGVNHFQIRQSSFVYSNEWMKSVSAGQAPEVDCP